MESIHQLIKHKLAYAQKLVQYVSVQSVLAVQSVLHITMNIKILYFFTSKAFVSNTSTRKTIDLNNITGYANTAKGSNEQYKNPTELYLLI